MRIVERKTVTVEQDVVADILCNRCGLSCRDKADLNYQGLIEVEFQGGYASLIGDMVGCRFSLCEPCLIELFKDFKHDPIVYDYFDDDE